MEQEPSPYVFKLHIQALSIKDITLSAVRISVEVLVQEKAQINI